MSSPPPQYVRLDAVPMQERSVRHVTWAQGVVGSDSEEDPDRELHVVMSRDAHAEGFVVQGFAAALMLLAPAIALLCGGIAGHVGDILAHNSACVLYGNAVSLLMFVGAVVCAMAAVPQCIGIGIGTLLHTGSAEPTPNRNDRLALAGALMAVYVSVGVVVLGAGALYNEHTHGSPLPLFVLHQTFPACASLDLIVACLSPIVFCVMLYAAFATFVSWIVSEYFATTHHLVQ